MKTLLMTTALVAAFASPVLAKPIHHAHMAQASHERLSTAQAASRDAARSPNSVFVNGEYVGADPDPSIRNSLAHEYYENLMTN